MRVSELSGTQLDFWVAKAEGHDPVITGGECFAFPKESEYPVKMQIFSATSSSYGGYHPSKDTTVALTLQEKYRIHTRYVTEGKWECECIDPSLMVEFRARRIVAQGSTPTEAILRTVVAMAFGEVVDDAIYKAAVWE